MFNRMLMAIAAFALAVLLAAPSAFAATATATATITGGSLTLSTTAGSITFATTLDGTTKTLGSTTAPTFRVADGSGTGAGWNVTLTATDLSTGGATPLTIAVSNFKFTPSSGTITVVDGQSGVDAPTETGAAQTSLSATTGLKVISAAAAKGMGTYDYTPLAGNFKLVVAPTVKSGTYTSTLTATVASGP